MLALTVEHFTRHQYGKLIAFFQLTEVHLPLHGFDHRANFGAGQAGIASAGDKAAAHGTFQYVIDPVAFLQLAAHFETVCNPVIGAGFAARHLPGQALQVTVRRQGPGELLADFQITQLFIRRGEPGDIAHINTVLIKNAAERIAGRHHIFMAAGIAVRFIIQLVLRDSFFFLRRLIDGFRSLWQQRTNFALFQLDGSGDGSRFGMVVDVGSPDGDR